MPQGIHNKSLNAIQLLLIWTQAFRLCVNNSKNTWHKHISSLSQSFVLAFHFWELSLDIAC